ncbi:hypothetical protein [Dysgonomonas termitidis]|uniref:Lipocalin-like domain-containing protein n=1 Tax=Dysgonomonas termitidis TaxID=1516126 RepID=A0ABV9L0F3_9BACT
MKNSEMKMMKHFMQLVAMCVLTVGLSSCQKDEEIYDELMGSEWVGDLGFSFDDRPVISELYFIDNGTGSDKQYYAGSASNAKPACNLTFQWTIKNGTLTLIYDLRPPLILEIGGMYIKGNLLRGTLHLAGEEDMPVTLTRKK